MPHPFSLYRRFGRDRRANFAVMTALSAPPALALTAFAIDEGSLFTERREAQSLADLAAIAAAANVDNAEAAAVAVLTDNGLSDVTVRRAGGPVDVTNGRTSIEIVPGRYLADGATAAGKRFEAGRQPYNAVEVTLHRTGTLFFGSAFMAPPVIGVKAVAGTSAQAAFSIGSRLAKLDGGIVNDLLAALVGGKVSLSAMDYNALLAADVDMLSFLDALAVQLHLTGVSYSDVLASKATVGQIAAAMADVPGLDGPSRLALQAFAAGAAGTARIPLSHLIDLGPVGRLGLGQKSPGLSVEAGALSVLAAAAALANGSNQAAVKLQSAIPGLTNITLAIAIGEPPQSSPWLAVGETGTVVRTAQTRIRLTADVKVGVPVLAGGIELASVRLPLHVEAAHAEAVLTNVSCPSGRPESRKVTVSVTPGIVSLWLAESDQSGFADFTRKQSFRDATIAQVKIRLLILGLKLLGVNGSAYTTVGNTTPTTLVFNHAEISARKIKSTPTSNFTQSLTASLIGRLNLSVDLLGLPIDLTALLGTVKPAVIATLDSVTEPIDKLVYNILGALGVQVGQADVRVTGATCARSVLVQ